MHLRALELANYRRFDRAAVEFPDGVIGILGPNGSGKSTLVEAIGWVLYGHGAARTTKDQIRRQGSDGDVRAAIEFTLGGSTYRVVREMRGKTLSAQAQLTVDGKEVVPGGANSHAEVTEYMTRLLGMDREAFFTSVVAKQNELDALSDMTPGERKEVLLRMLDVDAVDRAMEQVRQDRRDAEKRIETLESTLEDPDELAEERQRLQAEKRKLDARAEKLDEREAEAEDRVEELRSEREELKDAENRHADATARLSTAREKLEDLDERLDKLATERERVEEAQDELDALGDVEAELEDAKETFETLDARRETATAQRQARERLNELRQKRAAIDADPDRGQALAERVAELEDEIGELDDDAQRVRSQLERVRAELVQLRDRKRELADRLETFAELGPESECPTCQRPLGEAHPDLVDRTRAELDEVEERLETLEGRETQGKEDLDSLGEERAERKERLDEARSDLKAWRDARSKAETLEDEAGELMERLDGTDDVDFDRERYERSKTRVAKLEKRRSKAIQLRERASRLEEIDAERERTEEEREALTSTIEELEDVVETTRPAAERYRKVVEAHDEAKDTLVEIQRERAELKGKRERLRSEMERLDEEESRQEEIRDRVRKLETRRRYLLRLAGPRDSGLLPDFRRHLIARVRPALADTASALFTSLTDGRYTDLDLDEEYNLLIHDGGEAYTQDRFSGGEVDLANLCLRLAVGRLIAERGGEGLDVVVLDEVFGSQDRQRRDNILRTLKELTERFSQILVITHVEEVKDRLEHILVVEADDGTSTVRWE